MLTPGECIYTCTYPIADRRAVSHQTFTNELCQFWSYWTVHKIFTRYRGIIYAVNAHIQVAISHSVSEYQNDESGEFAIFPKIGAMATLRRQYTLGFVTHF